jgi:hypothetical protein
LPDPLLAVVLVAVFAGFFTTEVVFSEAGAGRVAVLFLTAGPAGFAAVEPVSFPRLPVLAAELFPLLGTGAPPPR